ncbi:MAG: polysaccharide biosynthesis protein [Minisyncoccia bacterium]
MEGKLIYCSGGAGSIGSELVRQLCVKNTVAILDNNETALFDLVEELTQKGHKVFGHVGDIRDESVLERMSAKFFMPEIIFHCAALKHVTPSAWNPREYVTTNILGTLNVLDFAEKHNVKVINISTDKTIQASSIMGSTKRVSEIAVKNAGHVSVRFGNVLGSRGSLIPIIQRQLDKGEPITITDGRMTRYFMSIEQACALIIEATTYKGGTILIMDMGEKKNILELAKEILNKVGKPDHEIKMIGMRQGETLTEELMSEEESQRAVKEGNFYVL